MITTFDNKDIARKQPHRVILDPLMHLRVNGVMSGLCGGQFMCKNDSSCLLTLMCPHAPLFHN